MFQGNAPLTSPIWDGNLNLNHLEGDISEQELQVVIMNAPKEKAPGPDGFIGLLFSLCWCIIKEDLMVAVHYFCSMNQQNLHLLNQAYIVLILKKSCPQSHRL
jgi:hypothetical protein